MTIPPGVATVGQLLHSPTTMATDTETNAAAATTQPEEKDSDGVTMPQADTGCWHHKHHKVCIKPVDTDEEGVAELPADIRLPASEARKAEEAGHIERPSELYALAVTRMMAMLESELSAAGKDDWLRLPAERDQSSQLSLLTQSFSLSNPRLPDIPLIYVSSGFTELTGYSREEAVGKSARFLQGSLELSESDKEMVGRMAHACTTMTDTKVQLCSQRKDGSTFVNQSSLFVVFSTDSCCLKERQNSGLLMCVHADVTGLTPEQCDERQAHAEELKAIIQKCLVHSNVADRRSLEHIRASDVRPAPKESLPDIVKDRPSSNTWLLQKFDKKVKMLEAQNKAVVQLRRDTSETKFQSVMQHNWRSMERVLTSVDEEEEDELDEDEDEEMEKEEDDEEEGKGDTGMEEATVAAEGVQPAPEPEPQSTPAPRSIKLQDMRRKVSVEDRFPDAQNPSMPPMSFGSMFPVEPGVEVDLGTLKTFLLDGGVSMESWGPEALVQLGKELQQGEATLGLVCSHSPLQPLLRRPVTHPHYKPLMRRHVHRGT